MIQPLQAPRPFSHRCPRGTERRRTLLFFIQFLDSLRLILTVTHSACFARRGVALDKNLDASHFL